MWKDNITEANTHKKMFIVCRVVELREEEHSTETRVLVSKWKTREEIEEQFKITDQQGKKSEMILEYLGMEVFGALELMASISVADSVDSCACKLVLKRD